MKAIMLKLPAGVTIPDGLQEGDIFQAMASFKLGTNGEVQLCEVDDEPVDGYKDYDERAEPGSQKDDASEPMSQSLQNRIMSMGMSGPTPA